MKAQTVLTYKLELDEMEAEWLTFALSEHLKTHNNSNEREMCRIFSTALELPVRLIEGAKQ